MKKNLKKIILLFCIILVFLILGVIYIYIQNKEEINSKNELSYINSDAWNEEIYPDGMPKLFRAYDGLLTAKNIGKSMYYFTTEAIPKYYSELKNATESEISEYYNENAKIIAIDVGIDNENDFQDLIASIQNLTSDNLTLDSFRVDKDTIKSLNKYTETILYITYKDNEEIGFNVTILNKIQDDSSSLIYTALSDNQMKTEDDITDDENDVDDEVIETEVTETPIE